MRKLIIPFATILILAITTKMSADSFHFSNAHQAMNTKSFTTDDCIKYKCGASFHVLQAP